MGVPWSVGAASGQTKHSSILALGDDSTGMLTLWSTAKERPLLIIKDVFAGEAQACLTSSSELDQCC